MSDTSRQMVSLPVKTFISLIVAIVAVAITIGGYRKVLDDFGKMETKIDKIQDDITNIKVQNAEIKALISKNKTP